MPLPAALHSGLPSAGAPQFLTQAGSSLTLLRGTATTSFHLPALPCPLPSPPYAIPSSSASGMSSASVPVPVTAPWTLQWGQRCGKHPPSHGTSLSPRKGTQITSTVLLTQSCSSWLLPGVQPIDPWPVAGSSFAVQGAAALRGRTWGYPHSASGGQMQPQAKGMGDPLTLSGYLLECHCQKT